MRFTRYARRKSYYKPKRSYKRKVVYKTKKIYVRPNVSGFYYKINRLRSQLRKLKEEKKTLFSMLDEEDITPENPIDNGYLKPKTDAQLMAEEAAGLEVQFSPQGVKRQKMTSTNILSLPPGAADPNFNDDED